MRAVREELSHSRFNDWLEGLPVPVRQAVLADMQYLVEFGRAAALPSVRHRIQTSDHFPDMSETRTELVASGRRWVVRCLAVFAADDVLVWCIGGDKAAWERFHPGQDWYEKAVPIADELYRRVTAST